MRRLRAAGGAVGLLAAAGVVTGAVVLPVAAAAPAAAAPTVAAPTVAAAGCAAGTGPHQSQLERHLGLPVDGRNSAADCAAIKAFQVRHGIAPAQGYAGSVTSDVARRLDRVEGRLGLCTTRRKVVCTDLSTQMLWIAERGKVTFGPYPMRSGRNGYETRSPVVRKVTWKDIDHVSSVYRSPMPYSMFFDGGEAFHTSDRYLHDPLGSHGCVHVLPRVARAMWDRVPVGTHVHVFGRKPGT